jgi:hypothetical protein
MCLCVMCLGGVRFIYVLCVMCLGGVRFIYVMCYVLEHITRQHITHNPKDIVKRKQGPRLEDSKI